MNADHPPSLAFDLDRDVRILSAMASNLTPYLYEDEMYGYLAGDLPRLTLGGLLMRLYRLSRLEQYLDAEQGSQVKDAQLNFEAERAAWAVHYEKKLGHELVVRQNAFDQYLKECGEDMQVCASNYPGQAEKRTMIEHLRIEAHEHDIWSEELEGRLKELDQRLRRFIVEDHFVFTDPRLQDVYAREQFWWLYSYISDDSRQK